MIKSPANWRTIGQPVPLSRIERAMLSAVSNANCDCLSFSGGIDSCLLLYFMLKLERPVRTFTITCSDVHPDVEYSHKALSYFKALLRVNITESHWFVRPNLTGDNLVSAFYKILAQHTDSIIAGDGIDEFACGYYDHQSVTPEFAYLDHLHRLVPEHLQPLNTNSGDIKVFLPYLDKRVTDLLWQIPLSDKVDMGERKKIMLKLAKGKIPDEIIGRKKYGFCTTP